MSHSLHHGYRIRTDSVAELCRVVEEFRAEALDLAAAMLARRLAEETVRTLDDAAVAGDPPPKYPLSRVHERIRDAYLKSKGTGRRDLDDDFECEANFVQHAGAVYVLLHAEREEYHDLFRSIPGVEEYRCALYCSEPQWGIPRDEWERRAAVWGAILKGRRLGPLGPHFELLGRHLPEVGPSQVVPCLPTLEARLDRLARNAAWAEYHARSGLGADAAPHRLMRLVCEFEEWGRTTEGRAGIAAHAARLSGVIRHEIGVVDLWGFDPEADRRRVAARLGQRVPGAPAEPPASPGPR